MLNAGWLKVGLWLIDLESYINRRDSPLELFRVTQIQGEFFNLKGLKPGSEARTKIECIHQFYLAPSYFECDDCRRKPGTPTLCADCLHRRTEFSISGGVQCRLPRFCSKVYSKYDAIYLPMDIPTPRKLIEIPTRYKRPWVI